MILSIRDDGEFDEIVDPKFELEDKSVYLFFSTYDKVCYLYYGPASNVRKQFIAANEARKIKFDTGFTTCNVQHESAQREFEAALNAWRNDKDRIDNPGKIIVEQMERLKDVIVRAPEIKKSRGRKRGNKPASKKVSKSTKTAEIQKPSLEIKIKKNKIPTKSQIKKILKKLSQLDPLEDHELDYIITSGHVFIINVVKGKLEAELLSEVSNGVFVVENYLPRFYIEDNQLIAIEMWRIPLN